MDTIPRDYIISDIQSSPARDKNTVNISILLENNFVDLHRKCSSFVVTSTLFMYFFYRLSYSLHMLNEIQCRQFFLPCCLPTPMALASGGSPMFPLVVHQPASPSIWPAVQSLRRGLSTNPGATMWCVCGCSFFYLFIDVKISCFLLTSHMFEPFPLMMKIIIIVNIINI